MKKLLTILTFIICFNLFGQQKNGYIGISYGVALPLSELKDAGLETGTALNLINAGFRFSKYLGLTVNWGAEAFEVDTELNDYSGFGFISVGPIISLPGNNVSFDIKPQLATVYGEDRFIDGSKIKYEDGSGFVMGGSLNIKLGRSIGMSVNGDYLSVSKFKTAKATGLPSFELDEFENNLDSFMVTLGFQYLF